MELFPAIDLRDGGAVRLVQGDFARQRDYGDPLVLARSYADAGARWIHVVDLDAARTGVPVNRQVVLDIAATAATAGVAVQAGGGVRSAEAAAALLDGGVTRVVLGTAAVRSPALVAELAGAYPDRVVVGLDHRGGEVAVDGWEQGSGAALASVLEQLAPLSLAAVVVTTIERDGMLAGPDTDGLAEVLATTVHPVVASGGVRSADDLRRLASLEAGGRRLAGAIVGRAIMDGTLAVEEAIAACATSA
jgi:phosphoribosylformimino-5-aminoimidazole carboxamide ribotide isomerase